jgi:two-component system, NarL family, sensor histidine kinase UhpB
MAEQPLPARRQAARAPTAALFWRQFLATGLVFVIFTAVLVLTPATVSTPIVLRELAVLGVGLTLLLAVNAFLLRATLRPLDGLTALMQRVDGQSLTAVLLELKRAVDRAPADLRENLQGVQEMVRASLDEARVVARRLRPGVLEDLGLISAITALATEFTRTTGVGVTRRLADEIPPLTREVELVIYRIAQESLTNVARHARASSVELSLQAHGGAVVLRVADTGRGLNGAGEGAGIRGMRERALLIGADLEITAPAAGGTEVRLAVAAWAGRG